MKIKISDEMKECFKAYKKLYNPKVDGYDPEVIVPVIGHLFWTVPDDVLWVYATDNEEGYDGHQTQIGVKKDGTLIWGFFSHCSCYRYEAYKGDVHNLEEGHLRDTQKAYELEGVEDSVLETIKERLAIIAEKGLKDGEEKV